MKLPVGSLVRVCPFVRRATEQKYGLVVPGNHYGYTHFVYLVFRRTEHYYPRTLRFFRRDLVRVPLREVKPFGAHATLLRVRLRLPRDVVSVIVRRAVRIAFGME